MLKFLASGPCGSSLASFVVPRVIKKRRDVLITESDGSSAEADSVVRDSSCFYELVDTGRTDVESLGNLFNREHHGFVPLSTVMSCVRKNADEPQLRLVG